MPPINRGKLMYIAPNTQIYICAAVPLDPSYDHTIYFADRSSQYSFFYSKAKWGFDAQSYQRVNRGYMRVQKQAEDLYDCNYLMFQNSSFGSKWFYAFITSVEYVNNEVSEIQFVIDVMQTWLVGFDYVLDQCFVEREHSATDIIGQNIVPENIEIGDEYVVNDYDEFDMNDMNVCIMVNRDTETTGIVPGSTINGIYTPVFIIDGVNANRPDVLDSAISQYLDDEIICVYQYPAFIDSGGGSRAIGIDKNYNNIDGYVPRNKKLFTYPYTFLTVSNNSGKTAEYRFEDFNSAACLFSIRGVKISTPAVICYPTYYRGITSAYDDGIVLSNFPECAWSGDTFKAWWAQNKASFVTSGLTSVMSGIGQVGSGLLSGAIAGFATANPFVGLAVGAGGVASGAGSVFSSVLPSIAKVQDTKAMPNQTYGQTQTDSLNPGIGRLKFSFYTMCIKAQFARIVDEYFDRYGYATKRNKVPNINVRPHWTFTKTIGCTITGSLPADDAKSICNIFNNGITFWRSGYEVGNYGLDNTV